MIYLFEFLIDRRGFQRMKAATIIEAINSSAVTFRKEHKKDIEKSINTIIIKRWSSGSHKDKFGIWQEETEILVSIDNRIKVPPLQINQEWDDVQIINLYQVKKGVDALF